ncbi:MAG TPA: HAD family hydrolase [Terracidiphilus sp.]|nr:HAD family hydrolase [Terracidiphilus sp.]
MVDPLGSAWSGTLRTILLDRDGVLNEKMPEGRYVTAWPQFRLLPGVPAAIACLNQAGLRVIVVSNQRGISLGLYSAEDVETIHANLQKELAKSGARIDGFYFCPHDKQECDCRKPLPGMFHQAQRDFPDITPATSLMIGDSLSDIEFGRRLGMRTVFIEGDPERRKGGAEKAAKQADASFGSLTKAIESLVASTI